MPTEGGEVEGGGHGGLGAMLWLLVKENRLCSGVSGFFFFFYDFANDFS